MTEQAKRKAEPLGLGNVEFQLADAEVLNFPENSFDYIFCSSALIWMSDLLGALRHWHQLLKPGGLLGFHVFADTAFVGGVVAQRVLKKYGVSLLFSKPTGTVEKCHNLLQQAGFVEIDINCCTSKSLCNAASCLTFNTLFSNGKSLQHLTLMSDFYCQVNLSAAIASESLK